MPPLSVTSLVCRYTQTNSVGVYYPVWKHSLLSMYVCVCVEDELGQTSYRSDWSIKWARVEQRKDQPTIIQWSWLMFRDRRRGPFWKKIWMPLFVGNLLVNQHWRIHSEEVHLVIWILNGCCRFFIQITLKSRNRNSVTFETPYLENWSRYSDWNFRILYLIQILIKMIIFI